MQKTLYIYNTDKNWLANNRYTVAFAAWFHSAAVNCYISVCLTHWCHRIHWYIGCAGLQLKRVPRVDVSHRWMRHRSSWTLCLNCVALRGPLGSQRSTVELGFLQISLRARGRRRGRVARLGCQCRYVGVLWHVRVLRAGEVWGRLHGLTSSVIETWDDEGE